MQICTFFYILLYWISQILLCVIFWDLGMGENIELTGDDEESQFDEIKEEAFDEDADLQARIWNRFQREDRGSVQSSMRLTRKSTKSGASVHSINSAILNPKKATSASMFSLQRGSVASSTGSKAPSQSV